MVTYFYDNETKKIKKANSNFVTEKFIVYKVEGNNIDVADRKAKALAYRLGRKLAGGYFTEKSIPYNFIKDYTVIDVPKNIKPRKYDKADKFIHALIESES